MKKFKTLQDLADFLGTLPAEKMNQRPLLLLEETPMHEIAAVEILQESVFYSKSDNETIGTMKELEDEYKNDPDAWAELTKELALAWAAGTVLFYGEIHI